MMKTKVLAIILFTAMPATSNAEIFKCIVNGKTVFSDKECTGNAEKIELKLYQAKEEDVKKQQLRTQQFRKDSKHNEFLTLRNENKKLTKQLKQLQKEHDSKLDEMREKTYRSGSYIATKEHGLFKRMAQLTADYKLRFQQIERHIQQNKQKMMQLQAGQ